MGTKFKRGHEKRGGRKKGVPNALTKTVKERVLEVFNNLQDDPKANLDAWARKNPMAFYQIAAKLIPAELNIKESKIITVIAPGKRKGTDG